MKLTPIFDRLLLRVIDDNKMTKGGLYIPDIALDGTPYKICEVVSTGEGSATSQGVIVPPRVKVGDIVMIWRVNDGKQIVVPHDGEELLLVQELHVVAIVTELERTSVLTGPDGGRLVLQ